MNLHHYQKVNPGESALLFIIALEASLLTEDTP